MIQAEQVEHGRVEIRDGHWILDGPIPELVRHPAGAERERRVQSLMGS